MALAGWFKWLFRKPHSFTPVTAADRMAPAIIREFKPDDFDACCDIYLTNERDHFPDGHFQEFKIGLTTNAALWLVIEAENEVIGVGGICLEHKEGGLCHLLFGMIRSRPAKTGLWIGAVTGTPGRTSRTCGTHIRVHGAGGQLHQILRAVRIRVFR